MAVVMLNQVEFW